MNFSKKARPSCSIEKGAANLLLVCEENSSHHVSPAEISPSNDWAMSFGFKKESSRSNTMGYKSTLTSRGKSRGE